MVSRFASHGGNLTGMIGCDASGVEGSNSTLMHQHSSSTIGSSSSVSGASLVPYVVRNISIMNSPVRPPNYSSVIDLSGATVQSGNYGSIKTFLEVSLCFILCFQYSTPVSMNTVN
jgi:hypothetical protein